MAIINALIDVIMRQKLYLLWGVFILPVFRTNRLIFLVSLQVITGKKYPDPNFSVENKIPWNIFEKIKLRNDPKLM